MTDRELRVLTLPLKREYFEAIRDGQKPFEYRQKTPYWAKRLEGREYDLVTVTMGYPKRDDLSRRFSFPWRGYESHTITHPHFDNVTQEVYAIPTTAPTASPL